MVIIGGGCLSETYIKELWELLPGTFVVELETDTLCGPFERGELCVKSKNTMNGYHNADSSETFDSDGWLKTGDIVYYDDEFFFYVVDRIKEMLKYRSWHVAPAVLERVILQHPAVNKAVVIGIPDEEDGDHPMALVLLNEDVDGVTEDELRSYVDERVDDKQKLRGGLKIIHDLPLTPSGKVKRKYLQKLVLEGKI
ncbi:unnamed protein product [Brassicogethes aeneus]|uniref:AMP-binding enzyme C-terminal domain-containing protein n=1 Tax=Brassicogethes aeneus TaxID=1431903 RepID=A0A9P0APY7_BRAAE|nr:unnamed protein product [Brassicogethes aeneus]